MIDLNRVLFGFFLWACTGMFGELCAQHVYRARYDASSALTEYDIELDGQWKPLKRAPFLRADDVLEVCVQNVNPRAADVQVFVEASSPMPNQSAPGMLATSLEMANSRQGLAGSILATPSSLTPTISPVEVLNAGISDAMGLPIVPGGGLVKMSAMEFKSGWAARGAGDSNLSFEDIEDPEVVDGLEEKARELQLLMAEVNQVLLQAKPIESKGAVDESMKDLEKLAAEMSRLESKLFVDEEFRDDLQEARDHLNVLQQRYPLERLRRQLTLVEQKRREMIALDDRAFNGASELTQTLGELDNLLSVFFPNGLEVPSALEIQTRRMNDILIELESATFEVKSTLSTNTVRDGGVLVGIQFTDKRTHERSPTGQGGRRLTWFHDLSDEDQDPMLSWEGFTTNQVHANAAQSMGLPGACGTWKQFNKKGQLVGVFELESCKAPLGSSVEVKHLRLGSKKTWRPLTGLAISVLRPLQPVETYRVLLPDEWTYVIEANETQGVSPAIGTILGYERFSPGPVQTGVALGVSYGLEQNSNLHLSLGPTLRLQTLPDLMLTGGVALSRMARLDPNYEAGVVYQRDPTFALEVPLVNRFDPSLFISLIFRSN